jgi:hypothetical protein
VRSFKRVIFYAALVALMISPLYGLEWAIRQYAKWVTTYDEMYELTGSPDPLAYSDYLPFSLPPNMSYHHKTLDFDVFINTNSMGYRGHSPSPSHIEKAVGSRRILVCGDSFTLGLGVEDGDTYVQKLQEALGAGSEVINAGYHSGYSPDSYYAYLVKEGSELAPDIVVLALYVNDIDDISDNIWITTDTTGAPTKIMALRLYKDYRGQLIHTPGSLDAFLSWNYQVPLFRNSHSFIFITQLINQATGVIAYRPSPFSQRRDGRVGRDIAWQRFSLLLDAMASLSSKNGFILYYLLIPPDPRRPSEGDLIYDRMLSLLQQSNATFLPLRQFLPGEAYFNRDAHINKLGHEIVGRQLALMIRSL